MEKDQLQLYRNAKKGLVDAGDGLSKKDLEAKYIRARQALSGYVEWSDENYKKDGKYLVSDCKLEWLKDFVQDNEDKVVIFYKYTSTAKRITKMLKAEKKKYKWIYSGTKNTVQAYDDFRKKAEVQYMVINIASGDAGLQFEMAAYGIFYETPEDPVTREQCEGRVARDGKTATAKTHILDLVPRKSLDAKILKSLDEGANFQEQVLSGRIDDWD